MTQQINQYLATQEAVRSNKAREAETARHNAAMEEITLQQHREQARHNVRTETLTQYQAELNKMLSLANLEHQRAVLAETQRSNLQGESIQRVRNSLTSNQILSNYAVGMAQVGESRRHNVEQEKVAQGQLYLQTDAGRRDWQRVGHEYNRVLLEGANAGTRLIDALVPF